MCPCLRLSEISSTQLYNLLDIYCAYINWMIHILNSQICFPCRFLDVIYNTLIRLVQVIWIMRIIPEFFRVCLMAVWFPKNIAVQSPLLDQHVNVDVAQWCLWEMLPSLIWKMAGHSLPKAKCFRVIRELRHHPCPLLHVSQESAHTLPLPKTHKEVKALPDRQALTVHAVRGQI